VAGTKGRKMMKKRAVGIYVLTILLACGVFESVFAGQKTGQVDVQAPAEPRKFSVSKMTESGQLVSPSSIPLSIKQALGSIIFRKGTTFGFGMMSNIPGRAVSKYNPATDNVEFSWQWGQGLNKNIVTASYAIKVDDAGENWSVTVDCPTMLKSEVTDLSLFGIPQWDYDSISRDVSYACSAFNI
jgi:hypothetical protein